MKQFLVVGVFVLLCFLFSMLPVWGNSTSIVTLPDGSSYDITCTLSGDMLVCDINKLSGKDLSHWVLDLGICNEAVVSTEAPSTYTINDPTTGATGWKFEPITDQSAIYTLTLNIIYPTGSVTATMKAGETGNYANVSVEGPNCQEVDPTVTPTVTDTPTDTPTPEPLETATSTPSPTVTLTEPFIPTSTPTATETVTGETTSTATATPTITIQPIDPTATEMITPTPTTTVEVEGPTGEGVVIEPLRTLYYLPDIRVGE